MSGTEACLSLLRHCTHLRHLKQVHARAAKSGLDADPLVAGRFLLISATELPHDAASGYALRFLSCVPSPDAFMYNVVIRGLAESDHHHDQQQHPLRRCLLLFDEMLRRSVVPDSFSFAFLLKAAANFSSLSFGRQLHSHVVRFGLQDHLFVGTTLVSMYGECGSLPSAHKAFDDIPQPNVVAWNSIVTACFRAEDLRSAESVFFERMQWRNLTSWNVMLAGYTKVGELDSARRLFLQMPQRDPVSWSTMIVGLASHGLFGDAFSFFRQLLREGVRPNEVSLTGILSACSQAGAMESGKVFHGLIEKNGLCSISAVSNALLDMYTRCGSIKMARQVFNWQRGTKSIVSWTSMIAALAMYGYGDEAIELFNQMEKSGTKPDGITFISLLYACSHSGMVEQGHYLFHRMEDAYGIQHSIEHYGCMVDLYGRAGLLDKAYDFVMQMPIRPNAIIWRTLLGACNIHGNVPLAEHVNNKLSEFEPGDSGDYVLLSNIYAAAGKWKDVTSIRRSMSDQKIKKNPGWSSIEVDKVVYSFVANDEESSVKEEAHKKLTEVMLRLGDEGYVPETASVLHDIEEEEKQYSVARHSEKLAVAFGLARMNKDSVIRIVKNLRVCKDCHTVMKLISKVYTREIVVRDRSRFHSFIEGSCSCRDYW